jgi:hypothetical protein
MMVDPKEHTIVSRDNILGPTIESLSANDQQEFVDCMKKQLEEVERWYLIDFMMDCHRRAVRKKEVDIISLEDFMRHPIVSNTMTSDVVQYPKNSLCDDRIKSMM